MDQAPSPREEKKAENIPGFRVLGFLRVLSSLVIKL